MKNLKFLASLIVPVLLPVVATAQKRDSIIASGDEIAYASTFAGDFSLLLSIVIGIVATFFVFRAASKMGGGLFGSVLKFISSGMAFVVLGSISVFMGNWFPSVWFGVINTSLFATGYILMVIGANKLLKGIMTN